MLLVEPLSFPISPFVHSQTSGANNMPDFSGLLTVLSRLGTYKARDESCAALSADAEIWPQSTSPNLNGGFRCAAVALAEVILRKVIFNKESAGESAAITGRFPDEKPVNKPRNRKPRRQERLRGDDISEGRQRLREKHALCLCYETLR